MIESQTFRLVALPLSYTRLHEEHNEFERSLPNVTDSTTQLKGLCRVLPDFILNILVLSPTGEVVKERGQGHLVVQLGRLGKYSKEDVSEGKAG